MIVTISIVTPSMNHADFINESIISVISQEGVFKIDYIIMDGGSTDGSVAIIKKYELLLSTGAWPVKCCGITFRWRSELDDGQTDAINKGFSFATGELFGWLNSDDILLPGALAEIAKVNWKKYSFCYGQGRWISREGKEISAYPTFNPNRYSLYIKCTLCQPTVFFRSDVFKRIGQLSSLYNLCFDYEYWLRAVFSGESFKRISKAIAESRMYPGNKSLENSRAAEWESWQLRKIYYAEVQLNSLVSMVYRFVVEKKTHNLEKVLHSAIYESNSNTASL